MKENYSFSDALRAIIKWKRLLLLVTIATLVLSIIIAILLPNYYKSTEIFYPYSLHSLDPKNMINSDHVVDVYGNADDVERLKQIGLSRQLTDYMIKKYDLYKRYDILPTDELAHYTVSKEFSNNYTIVKNDLGALEVEMLDKDPKVAAEMANEIVHYIDSINLTPIISGNKRLMTTLRSTIEIKETDLKLLDSLTDYTEQKQERIFQKITPTAIIKSQQSGNVDNRVMEKLFQLINLKEKYTQMEIVLKNKPNSVYIIEKAIPAVKKTKPVRWIIVVTSTFFAFFFTLIAILIVEFFQKNLKDILKDAK